MALQPQGYALQFVGGIDSKTDTKQVGYTKLLDLRNAVFIKQSTLSKRNGYHALGRTIDAEYKTVSGATGIGSRDSELIEFASGRALSYRSSSDSWNDTGAVASVTASLSQVGRTGTQQQNGDAATSNGVTVMAYEDATKGGVWCVVLEAGTQRELLPATQLHATGERPRCVAVDSVLHVYFAVAATGRLYCAVVNPFVPTAIPVAAILTDDLSTANPSYDAAGSGGFPGITGTPALIAWVTTNGFRIGYVHVSGVLGSPVTGLPSIATWNVTGVSTPKISGGIAVAPEPVNGVALVAYSQSSVNYYALAMSDFTTSFTNGTLDADVRTYTRITATQAGLDATSNSLFWWAAEATGASADRNLVVNGSVNGAGTTTTGGVARGVGLASRAWYDATNGNAFVCVAHDVLYFPFVAAIRISTATPGSDAPIARLLPGLSTGIPTRFHLPSITVSARQCTIPLGFRIQLSSSSGTQFGESGVTLATLDFADATAWQSAQLGRGLYLAGACPLHYDSARWAESGFHCAPDTASGTIAAVPAAGGSLTPSGKYEYLLCYEEIDALGELHQGATTAGILVTMGGADTQVTITIPTLRLTSRRQVRIGVYRSLFNDASRFFRVTSTDPTTNGAVNGYVKNDPTVDSLTFIDRLSDTATALLEPCYVNGGIKSNDPFPMAGNAIAVGKNRLFWTDPADPNLMRFSQELRDDTALEALPALSLRKDPYGGKIVAVSVMDTGVFAFAETAIYVTDGPGPDADGGESNPNNAFTPFALVTSDVGCKSPGSICQTPNGIAFQSSKGIKLLGRDRQIVDIGRDVYAYNDQTIVSATLLPDRHQVVFLTSSGVSLLWDYERGSWSKFTNHEGLDAVVVGGSYYYLRNDGRVFVETPGVYSDDGSPIPMLIETAWVKMAGYLQGWQKVLRAKVIGTYKSSHQLQIRYRINYQEAYRTLTPINVDANYAPSLYGAGVYGAGDYGGAGGPSTVYQVSIHINKRCESFSMQLSDIETTGSYGAAFEISELLLTGGVLGPAFPVGASRSH